MADSGKGQQDKPVRDCPI